VASTAAWAQRWLGILVGSSFGPVGWWPVSERSCKVTASFGLSVWQLAWCHVARPQPSVTNGGRKEAIEWPTSEHRVEIFFQLYH
jgi:hypothetical protein